MKVVEIDGVGYAVIPMTKKASVDFGGGIVPYTLEKAERIEGTDYYRATYRGVHGDEITRIAEFEN